MPLLLVLVLVGVPLLELVVVLQVGQAIGAWPTIGLLVATSVAGAWLLKQEGRRAWRQFRTTVDQLRWPGEEVASGVLVVLGGVLLLAPGFVTDAVGLLLLLPPTRRIVAHVIRGRILRPGGPARRADARRPRSGGHVLDVEVVEIERDEPDRRDERGTDGPGDLPPGQI